jgi:hypothetical protein
MTDRFRTILLIERGRLRSLGFANVIHNSLECSLKNQIRRVYHKAPLSEADQRAIFHFTDNFDFDAAIPGFGRQD